MQIQTLESFSSYTKGLYEGVDIQQKELEVNLIIGISKEIFIKISKKMQNLNSTAICLNGVAAEVGWIVLPKGGHSYQLVARVKKEDFQSSSSLVNVLQKAYISLGLLSRNSAKFLLDGQSMGTVKLVKTALAKGHTYLEELTFECSKNQYNKIKQSKYLGLDGSGFCVQAIKEVANSYYFSVHAGKATRKMTIFNQALSIDSKATLSFASFPVNNPLVLWRPVTNKP